MGSKVAGALGLLDFFGGIADRFAFGEPRFAEGLRTLERTGEQIGGRMRDQADSFNTGQQFEIGRGFDSARDAVRGFADNRESLAGAAGGFRDSLLERVGRGTERRENETTGRVDKATADAQAREQVLRTSLDTLNIDVTRRVDDSIKQAQENFGQIRRRLDSDIGFLKGNFKEAVTDFEGRATAAQQEAAASALRNQGEAEARIEALAGTVPPQVLEKMKAQVRAQTSDGLLRTGREARAADSQFLQGMRVEFGAQIGTAQTAAANTLSALAGDITRARSEGAVTVAETGLASEQLKTRFGEFVTQTELQAAAMVDATFLASENLLNQYDQSTANNILTLMQADQNFDKLIADSFSGLAQAESASRLNANSVTNQMITNSLAFEGQLQQQIAQAFFGNAAIFMTPLAEITGTAFDDYMNIMQLQLAQESLSNQRRGQTLGLVGSVVGGAADVFSAGLLGRGGKSGGSGGKP